MNAREQYEKVTRWARKRWANNQAKAVKVEQAAWIRFGRRKVL